MVPSDILECFLILQICFLGGVFNFFVGLAVNDCSRFFSCKSVYTFNRDSKNIVHDVYFFSSNTSNRFISVFSQNMIFYPRLWRGWHVVYTDVLKYVYGISYLAFVESKHMHSIWSVFSNSGMSIRFTWKRMFSKFIFFACSFYFYSP